MNNNDINEQQVVYRHIVLEGTSYEVGKLLGRYINEGSLSIRNTTFEFSKEDKNIRRHIRQAIDYFDKYCPGINDEIKGVADALAVDIEQLIYYIAAYKSKGGCSQMAVLPGITADGHIYVARNYDYSPQESDLCLVTTKVKGKASHIGFSELMFGRNDGINEYGLCISMSNAVPGRTPDCTGIEFWAIIRAVLDSCQNVEQAIELILNMPTACYTNFIIADVNSNAALIEVAGSHKVVHNINNASSKKYHCATNHFVSDEMLKHDNARYWDSVARYTAIKLRINESTPNVNKYTLKGILTDLMPLGACCHYYKHRLGTLWSVIYDVTDMNMEVCFGSPRMNRWYTFNLNSPMNKEDYLAVLPNEIKKPTWKKLPQGAEDCSVFEIV